MGDRFATIDMGLKEGEEAAVPLSGGAGCSQGPGISLYQLAS